MKKVFLLSLVLHSALLTSRLAAQNPVIRDQFTADPTARVFDGRLYLYPSHDIPVPEGARPNWFSMADYHVFSSEDLTTWQDHGVIVTQNAVPWGKPDAYSMWAPDCVRKNGRYYFYFPNAPKEGRGFAIGVATADSPTGPFTCEAEPIRGVSGIDPCVLVDDDGSAYIYWSGMGIRGGKLKDNMLELDGELQEVQMPRREGAPEMPPMKVGGQQMEGLPDGFKEGPFAFKRGDWYYLTFPWVRGDTSKGDNPTETLAYAMSKSPLGPWTFKGIIMAEHENRCWTNHHSLVEYKGQWYLFYHHNPFSPGDDKRRSVCIDKVASTPTARFRR
jgi:beta-xylosidase